MHTPRGFECLVSCRNDPDCPHYKYGEYRRRVCPCGETPTYNLPGQPKAVCCSDCKTEGMFDMISTRCRCGKYPSFNLPGQTKGICCSNCKTYDMTSVVTIKCKAHEKTYCNTGGNPKYKGYCASCFQREFPLDPLTLQIRTRTKEIAVRDFINSHFEGFQHDTTLHTGHCDCTIRRRIDHRKLIGNTLLVIETDENQHKSYDAMNEETRYDDLYMAFSGKWVYIRFNPDKYKDRFGKVRNPEIATRLTVLKAEIEKQITRIERDEIIDLVERIYLYYDGYNIEQ